MQCVVVLSCRCVPMCELAVDYIMQAAASRGCQVKIRDINDNCPILAVDSFSLVTDPALQEDPLIELNVTDADSTVNAEIIYVRTSYVDE